jgi:hypothetical protein
MEALDFSRQAIQIPRIKQIRMTAGASSRLNITRSVADHDGRLQVYMPFRSQFQK